MGQLLRGALDGFSGKVGNLVGYFWKGKAVLRIKPHKKRGKPTTAELANRQKFGDMQLRPLLPYLRIGFANYATYFEGFVAAKSYNLKNAVQGVYPNYVIDPASVLVSFGKLSQAWEFNAVSTKPHWVTINWAGGAAADDERVMVLAYDIESREARMDTWGCYRSNESLDLEMGPRFSGRTVHVYLSFVSDDRKQRSDSHYVGEVTVR
jgi:hypothetical protein